MRKRVKQGMACLLTVVLVIASIWIDPIDAAADTTGVNVTYHTQEEIINYIEQSGGHIGDAVTYAAEPSTTQPYAAGTLSDETLESALAVLNQIRYIAGLDSVTLNDSYNEMEQAGALVNAANHDLDHFPVQPEGMDEELYSLGYSGTSQGNLAWGLSNLNKSIVFGWMADEDSSNIDRVGHRRWVLNPKMSATGFGAVDNYYAMYAFDSGNTSAAQTGVVWPAQQMPAEYFEDDYPWTYSLGSTVDASRVKVTLVKETTGETWDFSSSSADGYFNVNNDGYGQKGCIIFRPDSVSCQAGDVFDVTITGLSTPVHYTVTFFSIGDLGHVHSYSVARTEWSADYTECTIYYACDGCGEEAAVPSTVTITRDTKDCTQYGWIHYKAQNTYEGITRWYSRSVTGKESSHAYGTPVFAWSGTDSCTVTVTCTNAGCEVSKNWDCTITAEVTEATCLEGGSTIYTASAVIDGNTYTDSKESDFTTAAGHTPGEWEVTQEATCETEGTRVQKCTVCGETLASESIAKTGHTPGEWEVTQEATCETEGTRVQKCTVCGETLASESIAKAGHTPGEWEVTQEATCETEGTRVQKCTVCGETLASESIAKAGHTPGEWESVVTATCQTPGVQVQKCTACGIVLESRETELAEHTYGEWTVETEATCTEAGERISTCTICGDTCVQTIDPLGHDLYISSNEEAACTQDGQVVTNCHRCDYTDIENIPATGHNPGEWEVTQEATCETEGIRVQKCTVCGETLASESIAKTAHTPGVWETAVTATCQTYGLRTRKCTVCGEVLESEEIDLADHVYGEWIITTEPTCLNDGAKERTCGVCGAEQTEILMGLGHDFYTHITPATCTESGLNELLCTRCDYRFAETTEALGHTPGEWEVVKKATVDETGLKEQRCVTCGSILDTQEISKLLPEESEEESTPAEEEESTPAESEEAGNDSGLDQDDAAETGNLYSGYYFVVLLLAGAGIGLTSVNRRKEKKNM